MKQYDAIIIGARCGGAPLAMLLARAGHKVLLVDRMAIGSDIMSTHYVKRTGASLLNKWGLLDKVCEIGTPKIERQIFQIGDIKLEGQAPACDGIGFDVTPRRFYLDKILVEAAMEAGVEVRDKFTAKDLIWDDDRVVGIKGMHEGKEVSERAKVVVGADGPRSMVANAVNAECYVDAGTQTCAHYGYYRGIRESDNTASLYVLNDERRFYITFPTNDDLDMVFLFWPTEEALNVRRDKEAAFNESLKLVPELEARVRSGEREGKLSGTHILPNFLRRAHGPGWALVGDAVIHRDPITAQGITNAFICADVLAAEMDLALRGEKQMDIALKDYDERQSQMLRAMFNYTVHLATLQPLPAEVAGMLPQVAQDDNAISAFIGAFLGSVPLEQVFPPQILSQFAADVDACHAKNLALA